MHARALFFPPFFPRPPRSGALLSASLWRFGAMHAAVMKKTTELKGGMVVEGCFKHSSLGLFWLDLLELFLLQVETKCFQNTD